MEQKKFSFRNSDLESVATDDNFRFGFEIEFVATPVGRKDTHHFKSVNDLTFSEFKDYFRPNRKTVEDVYYQTFIPEFVSLLITECGDNQPIWFDEYVAYHQKVHAPQKSIEVVKAEVIELFKQASNKSAYLNHWMGDKSPEFMFHLAKLNKAKWNIARIIQETRGTPSYGYTDGTNSEIWLDPTNIDIFQIMAELKAKFDINVIDHGNPETNWIIKNDASIHASSGHAGLELTSPILPMTSALQKIEELFRWMKDTGYYTNESCGFHIGISYKNAVETKKIDPLKLLTFLGEDYLLEMFDRQRNRYTNPVLSRLIKTVKSKPEVLDFLKNENIKACIQELRDNLEISKYTTANFLRLNNNGYIEFRIIGGQSYHKRFKDIRLAALRYVYAMKIALDPNLYQHEYYSKVAKLLNGLNEGSEDIDDLSPKLGDLYREVIKSMPAWNSFKSNINQSISAMRASDKEPKINHRRNVGITYLLNALTDIMLEDRVHQRQLTVQNSTMLFFKMYLNFFKVDKEELKHAITNLRNDLRIYKRMMFIFFNLSPIKVDRRPAIDDQEPPQPANAPGINIFDIVPVKWASSDKPDTETQPMPTARKRNPKSAKKTTKHANQADPLADIAAFYIDDTSY